MRELEELYSRLKDEFLKFNFEEVKRLARVALRRGRRRMT